MSQREAAERLNLTTRQVKNLADAGMPTRSEDGKVRYPFPECFTWYLDYKIASALANRVPDDEHEAKRKLVAAQAKKAELEADELEGLLVRVADVEAEVAGLLEQLRANLLAFPSRHCHALVGCKTRSEVVAKLEPAIHALMRVLAGGEEA